MYDAHRKPVNGPHYTWQEALDLPGAGQMKHLRSVMELIPFEDRVPAQDLLADAGGVNDRIACMRAGAYVAVYTAQGKAVRFKRDRLGARTDLWDTWWINVRNGAPEKCVPEINHDTITFVPPTSGYGQDWLLMMKRGPRTQDVIK
jgi:hypothetical protein